VDALLFVMHNRIAVYMKKMIGICGRNYDYKLLKKAGIEWVRIGTSFPFEDKLYGKLTERYQNSKKMMENAVANGIKVMGITPLLGSTRFDPELNRPDWADGWPRDILNDNYGNPSCYERVEEICAWMAKDLEGLVTDVWQIANELDIEVFRGPYSLDVADKLAIASAKGIRSVRPEALCGINPAGMRNEGLELFKRCYYLGSPLNYAGIDGYFGSWDHGDVEYWNTVIDRIVEITHMPVIINEWGYSSIGAVKPVSRYQYNPYEHNVCATKLWYFSCEGESEHTEAIQSEYLARGLELFDQHPHVLGSFMYCYSDDEICYHCGQRDCPAECGWGIVHSDGTLKKSYKAVKNTIKKLSAC